MRGDPNGEKYGRIRELDEILMSATATPHVGLRPMTEANSKPGLWFAGGPTVAPNRLGDPSDDARRVRRRPVRPSGRGAALDHPDDGGMSRRATPAHGLADRNELTPRPPVRQVPPARAHP